MTNHQGHVKVVMVLLTLQVCVGARAVVGKTGRNEPNPCRRAQLVLLSYLFHTATRAYSCSSGAPFLASVVTAVLDMRSGFMP